MAGCGRKGSVQPPKPSRHAKSSMGVTAPSCSGLAARFGDPALNINGARLDPVFRRAWGGASTHLPVVTGVFAGGIYGSTHMALRQTVPALLRNAGHVRVSALAMR